MSAKISTALVALIRRDAATGASRHAVAQRYGVAAETVANYTRDIYVQPEQTERGIYTARVIELLSTTQLSQREIASEVGVTAATIANIKKRYDVQRPKAKAAAAMERCDSS